MKTVHVLRNRSSFRRPRTNILHWLCLAIYFSDQFTVSQQTLTMANSLKQNPIFIILCCVVVFIHLIISTNKKPIKIHSFYVFQEIYLVSCAPIQWKDVVGATVKCLKSDKLKDVPEYKLIKKIPPFNKPIFKGTIIVHVVQLKKSIVWLLHYIFSSCCW